MFKIITDPDYPNYDSFFDPELLVQAQLATIYLNRQPVRAINLNGEPLWISIEDVEDILGVWFDKPNQQVHLTLLRGGGK